MYEESWNSETGEVDVTECEDWMTSYLSREDAEEDGFFDAPFGEEQPIVDYMESRYDSMYGDE